MAWLEQLHETFIVDDRYMWLLEGLGNTLIITFGALLIGVVIGTLIAVTSISAKVIKSFVFSIGSAISTPR